MSMRITDSITYANFLRRMQELNRENFKYNEQVVTGRRINRPSDDPVGFSQVVEQKNELTLMKQYLENIENALGRLEASDSRLNDVSLGLTRMIQLAEQGANDPTVGEPRRGIAQEVFSLTQEMLNHADANFNGRALFAGTRNTVDALNDIPANPSGSVYSVGDYAVSLGGAASANFTTSFSDERLLTQHIYQIEITGVGVGTVNYEIRDLDANNAVISSGTAAAGDVINVDNINFTYNGGSALGEVYTVVPEYAFNGTEDTIDMQVDDNTRIVQNVPGSDVFGGTEPSAVGVQNPGGTIFDDFVEFRRALLTNDSPAIRASLDTLYADHDNLNRVRAEAGGRISNLRGLETRTAAEATELIVDIGETENADLSEAISSLVRTEGGLQAALQAGARIGRLSLFDIIG